MKKSIFLFFLFLPIVFSLEITEIMYSPLDGNEWIEMLTDNKINFSDVLLKDNYYTDEIICCEFNSACNYIVPENTYFLIFDQDTSIRNLTEYYFCVDDNSIGNGLGNSQDSISILRNNQKIAIKNYTGSVAKGNTLALINNSWYETTPTPGKKNCLSNEAKEEKIPEIEISAQVSEPVFIGIEQKLFKIRNKDYPEFSLEINLSFYLNISLDNEVIHEETKELSFKSYSTNTKYEFEKLGNYVVCGKIMNSNIEEHKTQNNSVCYTVYVIDSSNTPCNVSLFLETEKQIYEEDEKIKFDNVLSDESYPFVIEYWIEDLFGNIVKSKVLTENTNLKSYTPKLNSDDKAFLIKSRLFLVLCNNSNNNTYSEKLVVAKGTFEKEESGQKKTDIEIVKIYSTNNFVYFGDVVKTRIKVIKGDTSKTAVKAYVEDNKKISEITSFNLYGKNQEYELVIPVKIKNNKEGKYSEGKYNFIVEGLGKSDKKTINVKNKKLNTEEIVLAEKTKEYDLIYYPENISLNNSCLSLLKISNKDDAPHNYSVWSYFYSGHVPYSGEREKNKIIVNLVPLQEKIFPLQNKLIKETDKELKLKLKIQREDRNVPYEITKKINLVQEKKQTLNEFDVKKSMFNQGLEVQNYKKNTSITSNVIYESSTTKLKNYSKYFLVFVILLGLFLLRKIK